MFLGRQIPACGFSLGLERILVVMEERGMFGDVETAADVMVGLWSEELAVEALSLARDLRAGGLRVDLFPEADKVGIEGIKYNANADRRSWAHMRFFLREVFGEK